MRIDRRSFLKVSAFGGGGVLLGLYAPNVKAQGRGGPQAPIDPHAFIRVGADGNAIVPAKMIDAMARPGDILFVRVHDGEVLLLTREAVTRRVQALAREFVPDGVSLVDELLEDRRREVEAEQRDG